MIVDCLTFNGRLSVFLLLCELSFVSFLLTSFLCPSYSTLFQSTFLVFFVSLALALAHSCIYIYICICCPAVCIANDFVLLHKVEVKVVVREILIEYTTGFRLVMG